VIKIVLHKTNKSNRTVWSMHPLLYFTTWWCIYLST